MSLNITCPLCKNSKSKISVVTRHVYGRKGSAFYNCDFCEIIFQFPKLSERDEEIFYKKEFENFMQKRTGKENSWTKIDQHLKMNETNKNRRFKYLNKFTKGKKKILEVGCSSGFMLYDLKKKGNICHGIEPSGFFQKYLKKNKIKLFKNLKKLVQQEKNYDIIMHFFVLEHIRNPVEFLSEQLLLLKKGGKIIFEIPCYQDALHQLYDLPEFERFYWSVAHPWYFNENSLRFLLKKLKKKFKIIRDQRYDLSNHLYWMKNKKPGGMNFYSKFLGKEIEEKYKKNLISKGYFDTLVGIIYN